MNEGGYEPTLAAFSATLCVEPEQSTPVSSLMSTPITAPTPASPVSVQWNPKGAPLQSEVPIRRDRKVVG